MDNIRDWCISRQLWWGHRIPIWHCAECRGMTPAHDSRVENVNGRAQAASPPEKCSACGSANLAQDPDVLDTWFSSALWPFSTLGWPDDTPDLREFYPNTLLISGYDILFFWDARMIMMGLHLMRDRRADLRERIPFRSLYLHSLVRDPEGVKMSKTRGNVIDPLEIIEKHGTDALRFTLAIMAAPGTDIALSEERILSYRAFANKIWNAARFLFLNLAKIEERGVKLEELVAPEVRSAAPYAQNGQQLLVDRWIFSRLARTFEQVNAALAEFRFHEAAHEVYHFFWGDFCDWYIEWVKPHLAAENLEAAKVTWRNLFAVFEYALRLLHPFMPFLTEELWQRLPQRAESKSISLESFPAPPPGWKDEEAERQVVMLQEIVGAARNLRAELKIDPRKAVAADFAAADTDVLQLVASQMDPLVRLANLTALSASQGKLDGGGKVHHSARFDLRLRYTETLDSSAETAKLRKELERLTKDIESKQRQLADQTFRSRAPEAIIRKLESTLSERTLEHQKLSERLAQLEGGAKAAP
jgi:valyl-tRNA synthetase